MNEFTATFYRIDCIVNIRRSVSPSLLSRDYSINAARFVSDTDGRAAKHFITGEDTLLKYSGYGMLLILSLSLPLSCVYAEGIALMPLSRIVGPVDDGYVYPLS